jgi:ATP-dependent helicase/nuclease subunit A
VVSAAVRQFATSMSMAAVREALARPSGPCELWRERRFEVVLGDRWISGAFDRVVVLRDAAGRAMSAEILDFKTSRVETEEELRRAVEGYVPQMQLYRSVLSAMLGLVPERIRTHLLFTKAGACVEVR